MSDNCEDLFHFHFQFSSTNHQQKIQWQLKMLAQSNPNHGLHSLEKSLNFGGCLEKSLIFKYP